MITIFTTVWFRGKAKGGILMGSRPFYFQPLHARKTAVLASNRIVLQDGFCSKPSKKSYSGVFSYWFIIAFITRLLTKTVL